MTDYSNLPARELDALVAREVMGWTEIPDRAFDRTLGGTRSGYSVEWIKSRAPWHGSDTRGKFRKIPNYSTHGRAMLDVLDALRERGWSVRMESIGAIPALDLAPGWKVFVEQSRGDVKVTQFNYDPSLPRAVCEAALAAVGGK